MKKLMFLMIVLSLVSIVQAGIVHRWSFDDLSDSVGGATAVLNGGHVNISGGQLDLSWNTDWAELPVADTLNNLPNGEITVEGWMTPSHSNPEWFANSRAWYLGNGTIGTYLGGLQFIPTNGTNTVGAYYIHDGITGIIGEPYGPQALAQNQQFHFAVTYKKGVISELYIDGVLLGFDIDSPVEKDFDPTGMTYTNEFIRIGSPIAGSGGHPLYMDEFRIYDVRLSADDLAANYAAGPDGAAIPEPATMILLGIGSLLSLKRRLH